MASADKSKELLEELKKRMETEAPLEGEKFFTEEETLLRFLKAREWNIDAAEKQLKEAVTWRRTYKPLTIDCSWCHQQPGYHSMRQVGFDEVGRPVIYSCFAQADTHKNSVEDSIAHCTYLIENAKKTMRPGVTTWIFVIDCTGMSLPACNPRLGYAITQILANYYPERLGKVFCVNHSIMFQGVWNAMKVFMHPATTSKMVMLRGKRNIKDNFESIFPQELSDWLIKEISRNKKKKYLAEQKLFYKKPARLGDHDARACATYIRDFINSNDPNQAHKPHPNIVDKLKGVTTPEPRKHLKDFFNSASSGSLTENSEDDDESVDYNGAAASIDIPEEFAIPADAVKMQS